MLQYRRVEGSAAALSKGSGQCEGCGEPCCWEGSRALLKITKQQLLNVSFLCHVEEALAAKRHNPFHAREGLRLHEEEEKT